MDPSPAQEPGIWPDWRWRIPMKAMILVVLAIMTVSDGAANAQTQYRTPAHNFYQNNWMSGN
jgi:hypothetical protein